MSFYLIDTTLTAVINDVPKTFSVQCVTSGSSRDELAQRFESRLTERFSQAEWPAQIDKTVLIPVLENMADETGLAPLDLASIASVEEPASYEDAGLWEDCHRLVPVGVEVADIQALKTFIPEEAAAAINWDSTKQLYFIIYIFGENEDGSQDAAVVARARNAPAAAWAWRRHGRAVDDVKWPIRVEALCMVVVPGKEKEGEEPAGQTGEGAAEQTGEQAG